MNSYNPLSIEEIDGEFGQYNQGKRSFDNAFADEYGGQSFSKEESPIADFSSEYSITDIKDNDHQKSKWAKTSQSCDEKRHFNQISFSYGETSTNSFSYAVDQDLDIKKELSVKENFNTFDDYPGFGHRDDIYSGTIKKTETFDSGPSHSESQEGSFGSRLMKRMGWKGQGLGKDGSGIVEPIQASKQHGHRGLGFHIEELEEAQSKFNPDDEIIKVEEDIEWLINDYLYEEPSIQEDWMRIGPRKLSIKDETRFCSPQTVENVVNSKTIFDRLDKNEMRDARTRSNPFETIRSVFFLNRAAVKMANIDRACNFMFTRPKNLGSGDLLYFADVCAGPGGFSEYILFRKKWEAKGFGFTLKRENDFKLDDFNAGPCETFHPYYGFHDDGDIFRPKNQISFRDLVLKQTRGKGVHFMMSDGGFSVKDKENIQEILSKQLYLCQCLVALMIVRTGGHFVTKLFDVFTPFSAGLVYLMYRCFDSVSIFKPNTSRPANSERYLICRGKRANTEKVVKYLYNVNCILHEGDKNKDVLELVPIKVLEEDNKFYDYLKSSNDKIGRQQIISLLKIAAYTEDKTLREKRQADMRRSCLKYWEISDKMKTIPKKMSPSEKLKLLVGSQSDIFKNQDFKKIERLKLENIQKILNSPLDWYCMPCGSGENIKEQMNATFYLGMGRSQVFRLVKGIWERVDNVILPADTLIYAESINEFKKFGKQQRRAERIHILDAYYLGGIDISREYLLQRHKLIEMFCEALWNPTGQECRIYAKDLHPVDEHLGENLSLEICRMKNGLPTEVYFLRRDTTSYYSEEEDVNENSYFKPQSLIFCKVTGDGWARHKSSSTNYIYFYDFVNKQSKYEADKPASANADFRKTLDRMIVWNWPEDKAISINRIILEIFNSIKKKKFSTK